MRSFLIRFSQGNNGFVRCLSDNKAWRLPILLVMLLVFCTDAAVEPSSTQTLDLEFGWNLVTLKRPLLSKHGNYEAFLALKPLVFNNKLHTYVICRKADDVKAGIGYWIFCTQPKTVTLMHDVTQAEFQPVLQEGWNLVGMFDGATWPESAKAIWAWEDARFKPITKAELKVGQAYWVLRQ